MAITAFLVVMFEGSSSGADKVRVSYNSPGPTHGVFWVAAVSKSFTKGGLEVKTIYLTASERKRCGWLC